MARAVELVRELGNSPAMAEFVKREVMPGPLKGAELDAFIRNGAVSYFHATCTCRMGHDDLAVVDHALRVRGIESLRIADGSVMPERHHRQHDGALRDHRRTHGRNSRRSLSPR